MSRKRSNDPLDTSNLSKTCSADHFKELNEAIEAGTDSEVCLDIEMLRTSLLERIHTKFNKSWEYFDLNTNIACLKFFESKGIEPLPSEMTPAEIMRAKNVWNLERKKKNLQLQIAEQNSVLANLIPLVDEARNHVNERLEQREDTNKMMKLSEVNTKKVENELNKISSALQKL